MRIIRFLPVALFVAIGLLLTGCGGGVKPGGLSANLVAVYATDASLAQKQLTITVRYGNENIGALGFAGATHKVFLNGTMVGKVTALEPFGIPPVQTVDQNAIVELEKPDLIRDLIAKGETTTLAYHLESKLEQIIGDDHLSYSLSASGSAELHRGEPPTQK